MKRERDSGTKDSGTRGSGTTDSGTTDSGAKDSGAREAGASATALPPGPHLPALVQLAWIWLRPTAALLRLRRYGSRATIGLPFQMPLVVLSDPADIREVLTADPEVLHPGEGSFVLEPLLGRHSVILLDEEAHLEQRRLLLPAFHGERLQALTGQIEELTEAEIAQWPTGTPVALHGRLQRLTLEIILRSVFGLERGARLDALRESVGELLQFTESPLSIVPAVHRVGRWVPILRRFNRVKARADQLIFDEVRERRAAIDAGAEPGIDILSTLLTARHEDGSEMSAQELRDELMTALVAGHETTASALGWALVHLAGEPRIQARLAEEIDAGTDDAYLNATVYEILRLRPVVPILEPRLVKRPVSIGGVEYRPGVALLASAFLVHHDPDVYPDPFAFRPERFVGVTPGTYTWLPFGGGRRRCVGATFAQIEMRIVLTALLRRFTIHTTRTRPETTARRSITFSPRGRATVILRARDAIGYQSPHGHAGSRQAVRFLSAEAPTAGDPAGGRQEVRG
jgi:cytochrome P450